MLTRSLIHSVVVEAMLLVGSATSASATSSLPHEPLLSCILHSVPVAERRRYDSGFRLPKYLRVRQPSI